MQVSAQTPVLVILNSEACFRIHAGGEPPLSKSSLALSLSGEQHPAETTTRVKSVAPHGREATLISFVPGKMIIFTHA